MKTPEHQLQVACVKWFRMQYPNAALLLFAIPNGGHRNPITAKRLKAEGVTAGVTDLILLLPSGRQYGLCIEMKVKPNKPSAKQVQWMRDVSLVGYKTAVCYSLEEFIETITKYLEQ